MSTCLYPSTSCQCICHNESDFMTCSHCHCYHSKTTKIMMNSVLDHAKDIKVLHGKIDRLENRFQEYNELVLGACPLEIQKMYKKSHPHKCPVCEGIGKKDFPKYHVDGVPVVHLTNENCKPCEGKGIVWG